MTREAEGTEFDTSVAGWFLAMRWGTVLCQVLLFAAVRFLFAMEVPALVLGLVCFEVASNLLFQRLSRGQRALPMGLFAGAMALDIAMLTGLIALTGGAMNPFTFLYLVHIVVGAILLPKAVAWGLAAFASLCYAIFFLPACQEPLARLSGQSVCHVEPLTAEMRLHLRGMWLAFVITAFFVVFFVTRIQRLLAAHQQTRSRLREERHQNERLASLAALSAGAAHEFATPLATIAVAAGELYREMKGGSHGAWLEDLELIRSQVNRCRDILYQMAADAGEPLGEGLAQLPLAELLGTVRESLDESRQARLDIVCPDPDLGLVIPRRSVQRVLRGLVSNAFHASAPSARVTVRAQGEGERLCVTIVDQGRGMDAETVAKAREPFFTTKPPGQGLGLGLYLASTLAERLGGGLEIDSVPGQGSSVRFTMAREQRMGMAPEGDGAP